MHLVGLGIIALGGFDFPASLGLRLRGDKAFRKLHFHFCRGFAVAAMRNAERGLVEAASLGFALVKRRMGVGHASGDAKGCQRNCGRKKTIVFHVELPE